MIHPRRLSELLQQALRAVRIEPTDGVPDEAAVKFACAALEYERADAATRSKVCRALPKAASAGFVALSARCALEALAARDPAYLRAALIALAIADFPGDPHEVEQVLVVVWYAARVVSVDGHDLFAQVRSLCSPHGRESLEHFAAKSEHEKVRSMNGLPSPVEIDAGIFAPRSLTRSRYGHN